MHILITGSNGQLGNEIKSLATLYPSWRFHFTDVQELDILDLEAIDAFMIQNKITAIVNCAAYTAVDKAESDLELCHKINAIGPENLAKAASTHKARFIHVSTDFVFSGNSCKPYVEEDKADPIGAYGATKYDGEVRVQKADPQSTILRTSWLYSSFGNNFVKTMLRLGKERDSLGVIFDQVGTPTYANDLAKAILVILASEASAYKPGMYHYSNEGVASWYDFTKAIHEIAGISCDVKPILAASYPLPAARPHYSVMNKEKIKQAYGIEIPYWKDALKQCMHLLKQDESPKNSQ